MLERLELDCSYRFDVLVRIDKENFAARLELTPEECTLHIMGEQHGDRKCDLPHSPPPSHLVCSYLNKRFVLSSITLRFSRTTSLHHHPENRSFFEIKYNIGFVLFSPSWTLSDQCYISGISIRSNFIDSWIGITKRQAEIASSFKDNNRLTDKQWLLNEMAVAMDSGNIISAYYSFSDHYSLSEFKTGLSFPPLLGLDFHNPISVHSIQDEYTRFYNLFSFIFGSDFCPNHIDFFIDPGRSGKGSIYFPSSAPRSSKTILFPLGHDLMHDHLDLPEFPASIINNYYKLQSTDTDLWKRYVKYRRLNSTEERFLGYFRLLEKLTFRKGMYVDGDRLSKLILRSKEFLIHWFDNKKGVNGLLKALKRCNESKYNTEKCFTDFAKTLPDSFFNSISMEIGDIKLVCALRNNLSHANDFILIEKDLDKYEKFVHVLLVLALFKKLGVDTDISSRFISRLDGFFTIQ